MVDIANLNPEQIEAALKAGIIDEAQANALRGQTQTQSKESQYAAQVGDEENPKFIRGFHDIFIALGLVMLSIGIAIFGAQMMDGIGIAIGAVIMWILAEFFARIKRQTLPSIVIAVSFIIFVFTTAGLIAEQYVGTNYLSATPKALLGVGAATFTAALAFYARFRLPFCLAIVASTAVLLLWGVLAVMLPQDINTVKILAFSVLASGVAIFLWAVRYDIRDPHRTGRFSDNAFWLHMVAAPLILQGIALQIIKVGFGKGLSAFDDIDFGSGLAVTMLISITVLGLIGLAINRRALLVASLSYASLAIAFLASKTGMGGDSVTAMSLLFVGGGVVFLGVGWHKARRALLKILPRDGVWGKVFPDESGPE